MPKYKAVLRTKKACANCGTEFKGFARKRFCSKACRAEFWQQVFAAGKAAVEASRAELTSTNDMLTQRKADEAKKRRKTK